MSEDNEKPENLSAGDVFLVLLVGLGVIYWLASSKLSAEDPANQAANAAHETCAKALRSLAAPSAVQVPPGRAREDGDVWRFNWSGSSRLTFHTPEGQALSLEGHCAVGSDGNISRLTVDGQDLM